MNEIAILIMAHKNQSQLELLIDNLISDFDLYIHIDTSSTIDIKELRGRYPSVNFYSEYNVNWGGYKQVLCPLFLFKKAHLQNYLYTILISGQDLPIVSNAQIYSKLKESNCSYIVSDQLPLPQWKFNGGFDRVQLYWDTDITGNSLWDKLRRKIIGNIRKRQWESGSRRPLFEDLTYYGGSNWVILQREALNFLIKFTQDHPKYIKSFKYSRCGDELWLQTIIGNSDCPSKNEHFTYLDWSKGPEYPRTLRVDDYEAIVNSPYLFARKFDTEVDNEIIQMILNRRKSLA